jgi:hypothetical protein
MYHTRHNKGKNELGATNESMDPGGFLSLEDITRT